jgi:hypothetical protein
MWNCNEIARSFDFRNVANCIQIVDYIKGLYIKKLKARQKTIKFPALALGIAETQLSWYMLKSSRLLKIYGIKIIHQR